MGFFLTLGVVISLIYCSFAFAVFFVSMISAWISYLRRDGEPFRVGWYTYVKTPDKSDILVTGVIALAPIAFGALFVAAVADDQLWTAGLAMFFCFGLSHGLMFPLKFRYY